MPDQRLYDVHLFAVVRRKVPDVAAESPEAAIESAFQDPDVARSLRILEDPQGIGEFANEFSHYLVDVVWDEEFAESRWFQAQEGPVLRILRSLIHWDEAGHPPDELQQLLQESRNILSQCV